MAKSGMCLSLQSGEQFPERFVVLEQEGTSSAVEEISVNGNTLGAECLLDVINQSYCCFIPVVPSSLLTIIIIIVLLPVMFSGAIIQQQMSVRDMSS